MNEGERPRTQVTGWGRLGLLMSIGLLAGLGVWAYLTEVAGAVVAQGSVVVEGRTRPVQHADGGVVKTLMVRDGDYVQAGDVLVKLDDTLLRANLEIYRIRLAEALARLDRLEAERAGADTIDFDKESDLVAPKMLEQARAGQRELFSARRSVLEAQSAQVVEQIAQFHNQSTGIDGLLAAKEEQATLLGEEVAAARVLHDRGLLLASQMSNLKRQRADLLGARDDDLPGRLHLRARWACRSGQRPAYPRARGLRSGAGSRQALAGRVQHHRHADLRHRHDLCGL